MEQVVSDVARYGAAADKSERKRLQASIVRAYQTRIRAYVRRNVPRRHWEEGEQVARLGLLVALEKHRPEALKEDRDGGAFWAFAIVHVRLELQKWIDVGVRWTKRCSNPNRKNYGAPDPAHASLEVMSEGGFHVRDDVDPELLTDSKEHAELVEAFLLTLTPEEQKLLLTTTRNRFSSENGSSYLTLVERAKAFFEQGRNSRASEVRRVARVAAPASPEAPRKARGH